eukprot:g13516.t1
MGATINNVGHGSQKRTDEMNSLAVSYLGKPLHFLASLLWATLSRLLTLFLRRNRQADDQATTFDKSKPPAPRQALVRLKNLPQSEEYFINKRGSVIHFRSYLPRSADAIKAVVFFSHGYGAHCNSPRKHQMGLAMPEQGLCMYQIDLEGHGYSSGERAYIEDYNHWVDDYRQLLELVAVDGVDSSQYAPSEAGGGAAGVPPHFIAASAAHRKRLREVPIFIAGESLGGALSILLGLSLQESNHPLLPRFKGEVLVAPAIKGNPPPSMLVAALRHFVVPLVPKWQIPSCLESVNRPEMCVLEADERRHANHDVLGYPGGLGWGGNMRFRTGLNLIDLTAEVSRRLEHVKFPFLIMHDPGDSIVQFDSSKELTYRASTPHGSPRGRELRPMKGWLHCLLTNCPEITIQHLQDWVLYQTALHTGGVQEAPAAVTGGGSRGRGRITKRDQPHVTRKTVAEVAVPATAVAAADELAVCPSHDPRSDSGSVGRPKGFNIGVARDGHAADGGHAGSPALSVVLGSSSSSSAIATLEGEYAGSPDLPPVRFSAATAGSVLDSYGSGSSFPVAAGGAAHNTSAPAKTEEPTEASHKLLDFFPKTAAAAAVAAAALTAGAAVAGDGGETGATASIDHLSPARHSSQSEIMQGDVPHAGVRVEEHGDATIPGGVNVPGIVAGRGEVEGGADSSLVGDLNIDSPSTVAGTLLSNDGEVASGVIDVAATTAGAAAAAR